MGDGAPVASADEAMQFVETIRRRYSDAGHHCFAWRLTPESGGVRLSDDGEPGGTAGQPILNHIDGARLQGVVFVVTRYFGGTKLGKGGLIRAYGGTAGAAIREAMIIEVEDHTVIGIETGYADVGTIEGVFRGFKVDPHEANYSDMVRFCVKVPTDAVDAMCSQLIESTSGRIHIDR